jgi:hypothetical protein
LLKFLRVLENAGISLETRLKKLLFALQGTTIALKNGFPDGNNHEEKENRMRNPLIVKQSTTERQKRAGYPVRMSLKGLLRAALVTVAFCIGPVANARADASATVTPAAVTPGEAKAILMRMADFMAKTKSFSVDVRNSYDVYENSGQKIEFNQMRKITMVRPDRLRVDVEDSNGDKKLVIFDGKEITVSSPNQKLYAQTAKPGTIDGAIVYFVRDLGMKLPLAVLLMTSARDELERRTQKLDYVEKTSILGAPAHHLAGRTESVDYQVWVAEGYKPLPLRVVLTYRNEKGQPQFRAQFSDWNLAPAAPAEMFGFTPPPEAQKIAFLAELPRMASPAVKRSKSMKSGGKK